MIILLAVLMAYLGLSFSNARERTARASENFLNLYGKDLDSKIEDGESMLKQIVYDNSEYVLLQSTDEATRYYAQIEIVSSLKEIMGSERFFDFAFVAEKEYDTFLSAERTSSVPFSVRTEARDFAQSCAKEGDLPAEWKVKLISEIPYIYKMYVWHGRAAGVFISVSNFCDYATQTGDSGMAYVLEDGEGNAWGVYGFENRELEPGEPFEYENGRFGIRTEYELTGCELKIVSYTDPTSIGSQFTAGVFVVLAILVISFVFSYILMHSFVNDVQKPMLRIQKDMKRISEGDYDYRLEDEYRTNEFDNLKSAFNKMLSTIVNLKIAEYEKQIEITEQELKNIRLQLRPHFFLNALTTISSLSQQGRNEEIEKYINALSKNVRYMFKSGLHTVTVQEELNHVENYFEMQELKYPGAVFYFIDMDESLKEWKIPQMTIHTIIENEYKYAVQIGKMLSIFIKVTKITEDNEEMLSIDIEDDGAGYPAEIIDSFNSGKDRPADGSRVGLWSLRRMLEIMYERDGVFTISNVEPHGCRNHFLFLKEPRQELK